MSKTWSEVAIADSTKLTVKTAWTEAVAWCSARLGGLVRRSFPCAGFDLCCGP